MPSTITMPSSTETFKVLPSALNTQIAPAIEKTTPRLTIMAMREPRNTQHTAITRISPISALDCMTRKASRVGTV